MLWGLVCERKLLGMERKPGKKRKREGRGRRMGSGVRQGGGRNCILVARKEEGSR